MATAEEDFSFPATTTDSPPRFIESPPLWRHSPSPTSHHQKPEKSRDKRVEDEEKFSFQPSLLHEDEEEKMDMLWEDLNDESSRSCGKMEQNSDIPSPGREVQVSCVKALKLSKANGGRLSGKKLDILVLINVLKKVFLMHSSHRTIKKQAW
ncbi:uncharacterized protein LOC105177640 [Sesamum indicum]|uniref:Uncharacterized protein LOC105177640 n=1 Tax=Sesamum indicum TaxID=4182 RepID=A0A6I9UDF9_SESIN|nr:uncharacterized protein LOC105177640 [Sesamum indicum]